jgi:predicted transcriptional regulator
MPGRYSDPPRIDVGEADAAACARRSDARAAKPRALPTVDAEWIARQMARHDLTGRDLGSLVAVTPAAVSLWLKGRPITAAHQRALMDLFGEPLNLRDATVEELLAELARRFHPAAGP